MIYTGIKKEFLMPLTGEKLAEKFYEIYADSAIQHKCQVELNKPWKELTEENRKLMVDVFGKIIEFVYNSPISMLQPILFEIDFKNLDKLPRRKAKFYEYDWMIDDDDDDDIV
jgi:hypothetical protein